MGLSKHGEGLGRRPWACTDKGRGKVRDHEFVQTLVFLVQPIKTTYQSNQVFEVS